MRTILVRTLRRQAFGRNQATACPGSLSLRANDGVCETVLLSFPSLPLLVPLRPAPLPASMDSSDTLSWASASRRSPPTCKHRPQPASGSSSLLLGAQPNRCENGAASLSAALASAMVGDTALTPGSQGTDADLERYDVLMYVVDDFGFTWSAADGDLLPRPSRPRRMWGVAVLGRGRSLRPP